MAATISYSFFWRERRTGRYLFSIYGFYMKLRLMVTAFIKNNSDILMLKRSPEKEMHPALWSGLGGHMEPYEIKSPEEAVFREIYEESGLVKSDIYNFKLKCIILRKKENSEIRQHFVYFGETDKKNVNQSKEGELRWISEKNLLSLDMPVTCKEILTAYLKGMFINDEIYTGVSVSDEKNKNIDWVRIDDFDLLKH